MQKKKRVPRFDIRRTVKNSLLFENNIVDIYRKVKSRHAEDGNKYLIVIFCQNSLLPT